MNDLKMTSCITWIIVLIISVWYIEREYIPNDTSVHSRLYSVIHSIMSA